MTIDDRRMDRGDGGKVEAKGEGCVEIVCLKCVGRRCYFCRYVGVCLLEGHWAAAERSARGSGRMDGSAWIHVFQRTDDGREAQAGKQSTGGKTV